MHQLTHRLGHWNLFLLFTAFLFVSVKYLALFQEVLALRRKQNVDINTAELYPHVVERCSCEGKYSLSSASETIRTSSPADPGESIGRLNYVSDVIRSAPEHDERETAWWKVPQPSSPNLAKAFQEYTNRHLDFLKSPSQPRPVIVYVAGGNDGYGNRMPGAVTAFAVALLTKRVFLVHWEDSYKDPCKFNELFSPFEMQLGLGGLSLDILSFHSPFLRRHTKKGKPACMSSDCLEYSRSDFRLLSESDLKNLTQNVILFKSDDYLLALLQANPHHAIYLKEVIGTWNMFGKIGRQLFHPQIQIAERADRVLQAGRKHIVAMHLRLQRSIPNKAGKHFKLPDHDVFFRTALLASQGMAVTETSFFLASDSSGAFLAAKKFFNSRGLHVFWQDGLTFGKDGDRSTKQALKRAIVDLMVLSYADVVVGTYGSSFTHVGGSLGGRIRYEVRHDESYWQSLPEPCYRFSARGHTNPSFRNLSISRFHELCHVGLNGKISMNPNKIM